MTGILNDTQINDYVNKKQLIVENYDEKFLKQSCYELRASNIYYDLSNKAEKVEVKEDGIIPFKPHQRIVIITEEKLDIPNNILARVITKGSLFSIGISPVCTYADPGFSGKLGIVLQNSSNDYIKLKWKEAIAKIEFEQMEKAVEKPYSGQHGYETEIWPIRNDKIMKEEEIKNKFPKINEIDEIRQAFGEPVAEICERIIEKEDLLTQKAMRWIVITVLFIIVNLILTAISAGDKWYNPVWSIVAGVISNSLFLLIQFMMRKKRRIKNNALSETN